MNLEHEMVGGRKRRLKPPGFDEHESEDLSALYTRSFG